ncbi:hypothetical protein H0H81_001159 [Sphagnurus paluster]|uniref:Uncharacterized protein n=1 Tax=Sphagnurus paluster TaxID=117069 RepID=A0A9P7GQP9_9AGAR|nr:hypothetical protein H0H81_001159 [Sphagnurus paluster]
MSLIINVTLMLPFSPVGVAKANEVLIWGKKKGAQELLECGFVNQIFPAQSAESFHIAVRKHLLGELEGLDPTALLEMKRLLRATLKDRNDPDAILKVTKQLQLAQAERFASGIPKEKFAKIARKEIKHKL